jgi:Uri superfamily endonuclease
VQYNHTVAKGIYVLLIEIEEDKDIIIGKRGSLHFRKGFYGYVGSALGGLEGRLGRHLKPAKKRHWHIDYLLGEAGVKGIIYAETVERKECALAQSLSRELPVVTGFGCSDCHCPSHLFFCKERQVLEETITYAISSLGLKPRGITVPTLDTLKALLP